MGDLRNKTISGVKWSAVERLSVQGVTFLMGLVLARLLTPGDFGIVGMLTIFLSISQTFIDSGFSNALIRKNNRTEEDCSTVFYFNLVVGLFCYLILYFGAPYIAAFYRMPILTEVTRVLAVTMILNSLTVVQIALFTIRIDFKNQAIVNLSGAIISGIVGIVLAYKGFGVWALVYQSICRSLINVILFWIIAKWKPLLVFSYASFRSMFSFGSKLLASNLLHTVYSNMSNLVIGKFYTSQDLGYYERGLQFARIPMDTSVSILQRVTFPILSTIQNESDKLINIYRKYIRLSSIPIFFFLFLLAALAKPIIIILLSERWAESVIYLQLYCFAQMFSHVTRLNLNLLQVIGRSDLFLKLEIVKKSISLLLLFVSIPFGIIAICLSQVLYEQISLYINTYYTGKIFGLGYLSQIRDFIKYLLASVIACIPVYVLTLIHINDYVVVIIGPIIAISIYGICLIKDASFVELLRIVLKRNMD